MQALFEVAAGSVIGKAHSRAGKNNQDAYYWQWQHESLLAVVCDGCGSSAHSEVGACLGARLVVQAVGRQLQRQQFPCWTTLHRELLAQLQELALWCGEDGVAIAREFLLFTVIGVVVTPMTTVVFAHGDGVIAVNGMVQHLGPFPHNAPPYLADALLPSSRSRAMAAPWQILHTLPTSLVQSVLIGTDGLEDFLRATDRQLPGRPPGIGPLCQFWKEARYFRNPDMVRRTLALANREVLTPDWEQRALRRHEGLLQDDTTLVVIRRRQQD